MVIFYFFLSFIKSQISASFSVPRVQHLTRVLIVCVVSLCIENTRDESCQNHSVRIQFPSVYKLRPKVKKRSLPKLKPESLATCCFGKKFTDSESSPTTSRTLERFVIVQFFLFILTYLMRSSDVIRLSPTVGGKFADKTWTFTGFTVCSSSTLCCYGLYLICLIHVW